MTAPKLSAKALAERKVKRQKQFLAVGSVVLLALVGFQLPKLLGGDESASSAPAPVATAPGAAGSPLAAARGKLPDTDSVVIEPGPGQLLSFGLFKSKDPFVPQLSGDESPAPSPPAPAPTTTQPEPQPTVPVTTPNGPTGPGSIVPPQSTTPVTPEPPPVTTTPPATTTPPPTTPAAPTVAPTSVLISTNGFCETVGVNGTFPADEDIFRLVWIAKDGKSVKIGIVGGSFDNGQPTALLKLGEKLTLVNTADGTRYVIVLKAKCDVQSQPTSSIPAAPTTTTTAPAPPTTTATTPIVTDSLDTTTPTG